VEANYGRNVVSKMADVPAPGYQSFWTNKCSSLKSEDRRLIGQFSDKDALLKQLFKVLCDIKDVAGHIPPSVGRVRNGLPF
jgi:hypothetical protein